LRVRWTTTARRRSPGVAGTFRSPPTALSADGCWNKWSTTRAPAAGVGYVNQNPNVVYLMVESDHLDWTLSVDEAFAGTVSGR
jgi:hypothetical protein